MEEKQSRMQHMRRAVRERNIQWAGRFVGQFENTVWMFLIMPETPCALRPSA